MSPRVAQAIPGGNLELKVMARTGQDFPLSYPLWHPFRILTYHWCSGDLPFTQRPTLVEAYIGKRIEPAPNIEHADLPPKRLLG